MYGIRIRTTRIAPPLRIADELKASGAERKHEILAHITHACSRPFLFLPIRVYVFSIL
jgi:hypothetical protein